MSRDILLSLIDPNPNQPRKHFNEDALLELADNIKQVGLLNPIMVRPVGDRFEIIHGERRWRACKLADMTEIPAEVRILSDKDAFLISVIENVQRNDLTPLEEAEAYQAILSEDMTQVDLGKAIGKSQSYIASKLRLLNLPPGVARFVREGYLSEGHAKQLLRLKNLYHPDAFHGLVLIKTGPKDTTKWVLSALSAAKPEEEPPVVTIKSVFEIDQPRLESIAYAVCDLLEGEHEKIAQWKVAAYWWGSVSIMANISVADLALLINDWSNRYRSGLCWWSLHKNDWQDWHILEDDSIQPCAWGNAVHMFGYYVACDLYKSCSMDLKPRTDDIIYTLKHGYICPSALQPWGSKFEEYSAQKEEDKREMDWMEFMDKENMSRDIPEIPESEDEHWYNEDVTKDN